MRVLFKTEQELRICQGLIDGTPRHNTYLSSGWGTVDERRACADFGVSVAATGPDTESKRTLKGPSSPQTDVETQSLVTSRKASIQNARTERLQTLEMVAVYMTEKACERIVPPMNFSKVVNLYQVSDAGVIAFKETNFEFQETLEVCEPVCIRHDGMHTLYDSLECRHPDALAAGALLKSLATCQHAKLPSNSFASLMT